MKSLNKRNVFFRIGSILDSLNAAERKVGEYILGNAEQAVMLTMEELAEASKVSYATINRFCRRIGYAGFKEFKNNLVYDALHKEEKKSKEYLEIGEDTTIEEISRNIFEQSFRVLEDSMSVLDLHMLEDVVNALVSANRVCFIGTGASGICARYAYSRFFRITIDAFYEADATLCRMQVSLLRKGDVLFAVSSSGRTELIVEAARQAKLNGVTVISLSDFTVSALSKASDYSLYTTTRVGGEFLNIDMPLLVGQMTIIDTLYTCCCARIGSKAIENYKITKKSANSEKIK